jgi:hypothetical protein
VNEKIIALGAITLYGSSISFLLAGLTQIYQVKHAREIIRGATDGPFEAGSTELDGHLAALKNHPITAKTYGRCSVIASAFVFGLSLWLFFAPITDSHLALTIAGIIGIGSLVALVLVVLFVRAFAILRWGAATIH